MSGLSLHASKNLRKYKRDECKVSSDLQNLKSEPKRPKNTKYVASGKRKRCTTCEYDGRNDERVCRARMLTALNMDASDEPEYVRVRSERGGSRVQQTSSSFTWRGRRTQRKRTQAAEHEKYLHPVVGEKRRKVERTEKTDRERNKRNRTKSTLIGRVSQKEVNERWRWRRKRWGRNSCRLGSREGSSERKWDSIRLCQGQFAVNGPLHLAALSLRGCMLLGASLHCMLGEAPPLKRHALRQRFSIKIHIINPVLSCKSRRAIQIV